MSLDREQLRRLCARHGVVARIVVAEVRGSAPREAGAALLVWPGGQEGTIGGGALELAATQTALARLAQVRAFAAAATGPGPLASARPPAPAPAPVPGPDAGPVRSPTSTPVACQTTRTPSGPAFAATVASASRTGSSGLPPDHAARLPLGPALGQCCGGSVQLVTEYWDPQRVAGLPDEWFARPVPAAPGAQPAVAGPAALAGPPLAVLRRLARARSGRGRIEPGVVQGWLVEPLDPPAQPLWIWGAGHVGRALTGLMAPLPGWQITWADTSADRFPAQIPDGVVPLVAEDLARAVAGAPPGARHLVLTYSHAIDLELCHALLLHGFGWAGLIGSDTKWARFRSRLGQLGHAPDRIARITCPIGRKAFGKHPQAIAIGVAAQLLEPTRAEARQTIEPGEALA